MNMIGHKAKQVQPYPVGSHAIRKPLQKTFTIPVVRKNALPPVAPNRHMIDRPWKLQSEMSRHDHILVKICHPCNTKVLKPGLTPVSPSFPLGLAILAPKHVWCADITYIPLRQGHLYLVVVMDWFSRYVLAWELSNSMESEFCIQALSRALTRGTPEIFNTDQGAQFSSAGFTDRLKAAGVAISMDGRGRALDNVFIERLWWSVKYEEVS